MEELSKAQAAQTASYWRCLGKSTSTEQSGMEASIFLSIPTIAWLWQEGPYAFQTSSGWLEGFAMGYETLCLEAICLMPAVGTSAWQLSSWSQSVANVKRADNFDLDGSILSSLARL